MVLREVEESAPDSFASPDSPNQYDTGKENGTGDPDIYGGGGDSGQGMVTWNIDTIKSLYTQDPLYPTPFAPMPFYARILGWSEEDHDKTIANNANQTQLMVGRPLTAVEVQAGSYYHGRFRRSVYRSELMGLVTFLGIAAIRQRAGRPGLLTPHITRFMGETLGTWYIRFCRYGIYGMFGRLQGQVLGVMVAANNLQENLMNDPNIRDLTKEVHEYRKWSEDEVKKRIKARRLGGPKDQPIMPSTEEIRNRHHNRSRPGPSSDHIPRTLPDAETTEVPYGERDESLGSERDYISTEAATLPTNRSSKSYNASIAANNPNINSNIDNDASNSDDIISSYTSPVSSSSSSSSSTSTPASQNSTTSRPTGSAWDRLRQQAVNDKSNNSSTSRDSWARARQLQHATPKTDSFTFSSSNEERRYAKAEAQREFDARVDKERRGAGDDGWAAERVKSSSGIENTRGIESARGGRW